MADSVTFKATRSRPLNGQKKTNNVHTLIIIIIRLKINVGASQFVDTINYTTYIECLRSIERLKAIN